MYMEKLRIDFRNRSNGEITCSQCASWVSLFYYNFYDDCNMINVTCDNG